MSVKLTVNNQEIKNPIAKFLMTLVGLMIFLVVLVFVFFLLFPLIWFWVVSLMLLLFTLLGALPKLKNQYKIIMISKKSLGK